MRENKILFIFCCIEETARQIWILLEWGGNLTVGFVIDMNIT